MSNNTIRAYAAMQAGEKLVPINLMQVNYNRIRLR
jgi:hypothetical protein